MTRGRPPLRNQCWGFFDSRTGERVSVTSTMTREQAEQQVERWRERDRKGGRPDVHDLIPHIEVRRIW